MQGVDHLIIRPAAARLLLFCEQFELSPLPVTEFVLYFLAFLSFHTSGK